jgi:S-adenosylmethionine synthetase
MKPANLQTSAKNQQTPRHQFIIHHNPSQPSQQEGLSAMRSDFIFTSESVTAGHPDKLCDQISDAIVDAFLTHDPWSRVIAECVVSSGILFLAARFASQAKLDIPQIARHTVQQIAYPESVFNAQECTIMTSFQELPREQYLLHHETLLNEEALNKLTVQNQATVFGFACNQTATFMPLPIWLAHQLARHDLEC